MFSHLSERTFTLPHSGVHYTQNVLLANGQRGRSTKRSEKCSSQENWLDKKDNLTNIFMHSTHSIKSDSIRQRDGIRNDYYFDFVDFNLTWFGFIKFVMCRCCMIFYLSKWFCWLLFSASNCCLSITAIVGGYTHFCMIKTIFIFLIMSVHQ